MISHLFNQTCTVVETAQSLYGDQVEESTTEYDCRFREITDVVSGSNREELGGADALLWVEADTPVSEGTIIKHEGIYWRVVRVTKARKMDSEVQFLKCLLERHSEPAEEENVES